MSFYKSRYRLAKAKSLVVPPNSAPLLDSLMEIIGMKNLGCDFTLFFEQLPAFIRYSLEGILICGLFLLASNVGEQLSRSYYFLSN